MPKIPININGVRISFAATVGNDVHQRIIDALNFTISPNVAPGYRLEEVYISSAFDGHTGNPSSNHHKKRAVDLSRINGTKMIIGYPRNPTVKNIVQSLQLKFETFNHKRENFGPYLKKKSGVSRPDIGGHKDHIHWSVNG
jgi:hypothetical protein